ncbi:MAG: nitroreductase family protein, partial [Candidatus Hodarchaeales archaeon]
MIKILSDTCTTCRKCIIICPAKIYRSKGQKDEKISVEDVERCIFCGHCLSVCPTDAIRHEKLDYTKFKKIPQLSVNLQNLKELIQTRRSIRRFKKKLVPKDLIQELIEVARFAPTGTNLQNIRYLILQGDEIPPFVTEIRNFYAKRLKQLNSAIGNSVSQERISRYIKIWEYWLDEAKKGNDAIFYNPPVVILAYAPKHDLMAPLNVGFVIGNLMLAAHSANLGTVNIGFALAAIARNPDIKTKLGISDQYNIHAV